MFKNFSKNVQRIFQRILKECSKKEREILVLNKESEQLNDNTNGSILAQKENDSKSDYAPETRISTFKYDNGIEAIHVRQNKVLDMIILPYQGHQIWSLNYYRKYRSSTAECINKAKMQ